jgi:hypothetical protein
MGEDYMKKAVPAKRATKPRARINLDIILERGLRERKSLSFI